jgi:Cof subfamily protein (haloacid dehalogenase superfamily)
MATNTRYRLLAVDLDGTLLDRSERISERNLKAVRRAKEAGVLPVVATGRSRASAAEYIRAIDPAGHAITYNGALVHRGTDVLKRFALGPGVVQEAVALLKELGHPPIVYTVDERKYHDAFDLRMRDFFSFSKGTETRLSRVRDLAACDWDGVLRVSAITGADRVAELHAAVGRKMGDRVRTVDTLFPEWDFWIFEILDRSCSKSSALAFLCAELGVAREEVFAIGDNDNDIDMLAWAGCGVAMKNALPRVKEAAAHVTDGDNDGDGFAEAIERFLLRAPL